jgi:aspartate carbamoyltransferase catalytic subunit
MLRHLLTLRELPRDELEVLLDAAQAAADGETPDLRGTAVATLFYEPSTRTEMSFTLAARRAGADVVRCDVEHSSVRKGESLVDTARTIAALGVEILVVRHPAAGAPAVAARSVPCAVMNAGDGMHEHPTQGLLDLLTVRQIKGRIAGLRVAVVGDVAHSRVARSAAWGFTRFGATVVLAGPPTLLPANPPAPGVEITTSLEAAVSGADVVMALRLQRERQAAGDVPTLAEYSRLYGVSESILRRAAPDVIVMHPGPANVGVEITAEVAYGPRAVITRQVQNGVFVRMAALHWALGGHAVESRTAAEGTHAVVSHQPTAVVG